jgi:hypothetical protein
MSCKPSSRTAWGFSYTITCCWLFTFLLNVNYVSNEENTSFCILFLSRLKLSFKISHYCVHRSFTWHCWHCMFFLYKTCHYTLPIVWCTCTLQKYCKLTLSTQKNNFMYAHWSAPYETQHTNGLSISYSSTDMMMQLAADSPCLTVPVIHYDYRIDWGHTRQHKMAGLVNKEIWMCGSGTANFEYHPGTAWRDWERPHKPYVKIAHATPLM